MNYNMNVTGTIKYPMIAYCKHTHTQQYVQKREVKLVAIYYKHNKRILVCSGLFFIRLINRRCEAAVEFSWAQTFCTVPHRSSETWADIQEC